MIRLVKRGYQKIQRVSSLIRKRRRIGFNKEHRKAMSDVSPSVTPEWILQSVWAFAPPLAIEAAIRHRVFDALAKKPLSLAELEQATGASARGLFAIANLLVGLSLLNRNHDGRYALTPESDAFLVSSKPSFVGGIFRHMS